MKTPDETNRRLEQDEIDEALRKVRFADVDEGCKREPKTLVDIETTLKVCKYGCQQCYRCPYGNILLEDEDSDECCEDSVKTDALALIQQLQAERDAMKEALGLMVYQYCVSGTELDHRYMCAGETAFRVLGLEQYGDTRTLESWLFPECQEPEA